MKNLKQYINESQQINESILSSFDVSAVVVISTILSSLMSIGITVTGQFVRSLLSSVHHSKTRDKKNNILMKLKELTRSVPDITDKAAISVLNNPGEWTSTMIDELRRALFEKMTDEQKKEFEQLEKEYLSKRNKFYAV